MTPDISMTHDFLAQLDTNPTFTFQTFNDNKNRKDRSRARVLHGSLDEHLRELTDLQRRGAGAFVMVNQGDGIVHEGAKTCRTKANVIRVRSLFVDLDGASPDKIMAQKKRPIIVQSSPGRWHAYWPVTGMVLDHFSDLQRRLAQAFQGDPSVHDLPRVMRLPGFWHQKGEPFMTTLER